MKILQITTSINSGSVGRITEDIGKVLMANGHKSYIAYGRGNHYSQSKLIKIGNQLDVYMHGIKTVIFDRHGFASKNATLKLIKQIESIKPDVLGLHTIHGYYINIRILFNSIAKWNIPVLWTFHDCWAFTGHCSYFDSIGCEKWKTQCYQCPKTRFYPSSYIFDNSEKNYLDKKMLFNLSDKVQLITPSYWLENLVSQSFLNHPVITIHNGIDLNIFKPYPQGVEEISRKYQLINQKIVLGVASVWDKRKGLDDFLKLRKLLPPNINIVLVGLSAKLIKTLPDGITGIQRTESVTELAAIYAQSDVFVNPTYQDNFPTTNIEALACGTPVITYNTGGSPEAIDEYTGMVVEKGDIQGLANSIQQILGKGKEHYSPLCRTRAEKFFNKDDRYLDYLNLYTKMLEPKNNY